MTTKTAIAPVSVIIPCFNCAQTLERAIASIASQTLKPAEIVLVDDASTDSSQQEIERIRNSYGRNWIRAITLKDNRGPATARNEAWGVALQPYLAFLDADDSWYPNKIEVQWTFMNMHPDIDLCGHRFHEQGMEKVIGSTLNPHCYKLLACTQLLFSNRLATRTVMMKRNVDYRFASGKRYAEDYLLWLQMACDGKKVALLGSTLAYAYKAPYGAAGLSARLWEMEKGEQETYSILVRQKRINRLLFAVLSIYSYIRYIRRVIMVWRKHRRATLSGSRRLS
jgi:glycosyltransferase involved in cell wall biosynthesis